MKMKLPTIDRKEMFKESKVGDKFIIIEYSPWYNQYYFGEIVIKNITPTGKLRMSNGKLWNDIPSNVYPDTKEIQDITNKIKKENLILNKLHEAQKKENRFKNLEFEEILELEKLLDKILN